MRSHWKYVNIFHFIWIDELRSVTGALTTWLHDYAHGRYSLCAFQEQYEESNDSKSNFAVHCALVVENSLLLHYCAAVDSTSQIGRAHV